MSEYLDYLMELFEQIDGVEPRRMFGGHGIFKQGLMFALIADDTLYFKVDEQTRGDYESRGLTPFTYARQGKQVALSSYYLAPAEALDDPDSLREFAVPAFEAALRADRKKGRGKK